LNNSTLQAAIARHHAGVCVIPTRADKSPALKSFTPYFTARSTLDEIHKWFGNGNGYGIGLVCGDVSGHLELLDFDMQGERFQAWVEIVEAERPGLFANLVHEKTPSGGDHIWYRCPSITIPGAQKLALRGVECPDANEIEIGGKKYKPRKIGDKFIVEVALIETKGQGGQGLCDPSPGYRLIQGALEQLPEISADDRDVLLRAAKSLNEWLRPKDVRRPEHRGRGLKPGEEFNERGDALPFLERAGWKFHSQRGNRAYFTRPGKQRGVSASLLDGKVFYCFTSSGAPFDPDTAYSLFAVYAMLEHDGDYGAAAKALAREGYGDPKKSDTPTFDAEVEGIVVQEGKLPFVVDNAEKEILMRSDLLPEHRVFQRSTQLVRIAHMPATGTANGVTRHQGAARIMEVDKSGLQDVLGRYGVFKKWDRRAKGYRHIDTPKEIAETYISRCGMWNVPVLRGIVAGPTIMPDGRIIANPGYDAETGFYFSHNLTINVPEKPTLDDAKDALTALGGLLCGFNFLDSADSAVALAQIVTLLVRPATETAPLIATTAPTRGSGKSKLGDVAAAIGTGRPCTVLSATADPIELEKRIGGIMLSGDPLVSLDNVNGVLRSDLLCQAITAPAVKVRRLGASDPIEVPNVATWLANGNNLNLAGDLARRAILCRLDPGCERPEERVFDFDPVSVALEHRSKYVSAVFTLVRAFILSGSPDLGLKPFGSFETWCRIVREPLVWAGCADPCASREEILEDDPDATQLRALVAAWKERFGRTPRIVRELVKAGEEEDSPLGAVLEDIAGDGRGNINTKRLGWWLRQHAGRIVDGFRITVAATKPMATWKILPASE